MITSLKNNAINGNKKEVFFSLALIPANKATAIMVVKPLKPKTGAQINLTSVVTATNTTAKTIERLDTFIRRDISTKIGVKAVAANGFFKVVCITGLNTYTTGTKALYNKVFPLAVTVYSWLAVMVNASPFLITKLSFSFTSNAPSITRIISNEVVSAE